MKILTVVVPCYNSQDYMEKAIQSALAGGEDVEVIIVDDGSKDETAKIGDKFEKEFPGQVRAIHQENGGHGQAVNTGVEAANGLYLKVLDSDDWFDEEALKTAVTELKKLLYAGETVDMFLANYVYEKPSVNKSKVIDYVDVFPQNRVFSWKETGKMKISQNILMHSVIYRTQILRDCELQLPMHTFYVDNIFVYQPLPFVKKMYYMDLDLYRYFIGREDQSVNEKVMISRIDQQLKVTKIMIDLYDLPKFNDKKLRSYMIKYLTMMMAVSSVFLLKDGSEESLEKKKELWRYLKDANLPMYRMVSRQALGVPMKIRGKAGTNIVIWGYKLGKKIYGFN